MGVKRKEEVAEAPPKKILKTDQDDDEDTGKLHFFLQIYSKPFRFILKACNIFIFKKFVLSFCLICF